MKWPLPKSLQLKHKYAINSQYLGDDRILAWSNLGYWDAHCTDYVQACRQLADQLAMAIDLKAQDALLDLGCGQGASLLHWQQVYGVTDLTAVELQASCVAQIQQHIAVLPTLYRASFLQLAELNIQKRFDAILCIDAAYHCALAPFLAAVCSVLAPQGRLGFHYLALSEQFFQLSDIQQKRYAYLLKAADVNIHNLSTMTMLQQQLEQQGFDQVDIQDISIPVLKGFADCFQHLKTVQAQHRFNIDYFKIMMTAKLCQQLYQQGMLQYVQVSARYGLPATF